MLVRTFEGSRSRTSTRVKVSADVGAAEEPMMPPAFTLDDAALVRSTESESSPRDHECHPRRCVSGISSSGKVLSAERALLCRLIAVSLLSESRLALLVGIKIRSFLRTICVCLTGDSFSECNLRLGLHYAVFSCLYLRD